MLSPSWAGGPRGWGAGRAARATPTERPPAPGPCPRMEERHGEGWQSPDGRGRRVLREVQGEAEDLERPAGQDGEWSSCPEGHVPGVRHGDVQDPAADVSPPRSANLDPPV